MGWEGPKLWNQTDLGLEPTPVPPELCNVGQAAHITEPPVRG